MEPAFKLASQLGGGEIGGAGDSRHADVSGLQVIVQIDFGTLQIRRHQLMGLRQGFC